MPGTLTQPILLAILAFSFGVSPAFADQSWKLPQSPPPARFGNLLIDRTSSANKEKSVMFSHWLHRTRFTCRVCHGELDFAMKVNGTTISEAANKAGKFCGAAGCHDGIAAFGHVRPHCIKCHNGNLDQGAEKFADLDRLPKAPFGNNIDWVAALADKLIIPVSYLKVAPKGISMDKTLQIDAGWNFVPPSVFPHKAHTDLLDCDTCHPDLFAIQRKGTRDFTMEAILNGRYCGYCHLKVAFPMNDCQRCHPGIKQW